MTEQTPASTATLPDLDEKGAPYHDLLGLRLEHWAEGHARLVCEAGDQHRNRSGIIHGGLVLSMIDQAAGYSGLWCSVPGNLRKAVTLDLDCKFTGQVKGGRLVAEARVATRGRNIFFVRTEVFDAEGKLVAFGSSTHRWRAGSETHEGQPANAPDRG
ncbi:PaaI family thioesterase [Falsiroseomonas sp.]|uniref:PaaI family thioesterase n=1 Tax=Falsiroseomonas sp. TaxID=2870721 RepID=UPI003F6FA52B